jgi:hypothetical protein
MRLIHRFTLFAAAAAVLVATLSLARAEGIQAGLWKVTTAAETGGDGEKLHFHLICKGQLDMELTGAFDFDSPHHYTGTVESKASMAGLTAPPSVQKFDANWVSECK